MNCNVDYEELAQYAAGDADPRIVSNPPAGFPP